MRPLLMLAAVVGVGLASAALAPADARSPAPAAGVDRVVTTAWLAGRLDDPAVVVLNVVHDEAHEHDHIPGARPVAYSDVIGRNGELSTELPPLDRVRGLFERLGVSDSTLVVVYAHDVLMATRVLFTLEALGHDRAALLDGGLAKWRAERRPVSTERPRVRPGRLTHRPRTDVAVTSDWVRARAGRRGVSLIDTRTDGEYLGTGSRYNVRSHGHIAGARQLQWEELFEADRVTLRPRAELARLYAGRVTPGDTVVTYCLVGYRASATWFAARLLGYPARMYDGSYQDWSAKQLELTAGPVP